MTSFSPAVRPVVLVTGAGRRLGRDIALHLAEHGFDLAIHYRSSAVDAANTAADAQKLGANAHLFAADLSDENSCRALVPQIVSQLKRLDAVVNNASTFEFDEAKTFTYRSMELHLRANTGPAIILAQALHEHLLARGNATGAVVNLLDQKLFNQNPDYFSYTLSKAALNEATTMLAQVLAPKVRVCGVAPGVTLTSGDMTSAELEQAQRSTPLGHSSQPSDIAQAVRYLLQATAVTGTTLIVDGGQHLQKTGRDIMFTTRQTK